MGRHLIVDGYNVIKQDLGLRRVEARSLAEARETLITRIANARGLRHDQVTIVFDGWDSGNLRESRERRGKITVVYSKHGERADEVIKRLATEGKEAGELLVVTDDREIRGYVEMSGQETVRVPRPRLQSNPRYDGLQSKEVDALPERSSPKKGNPRQAKKDRTRPAKLW